MVDPGLLDEHKKRKTYEKRPIEMKQREVLPEMELTMVPSPPTRSRPDLSVPASERADGSCGTRCRHFWCAVKQQDVEVEFETRAVLGFRRIVGVRRCSAFEEPDKVACGRYCLESKFRSQWPYALPLAGYRVTSSR
jgi:hypothetical protein